MEEDEKAFLTASARIEESGDPTASALAKACLDQRKDIRRKWSDAFALSHAVAKGTQVASPQKAVPPEITNLLSQQKAQIEEMRKRLVRKDKVIDSLRQRLRDAGLSDVLDDTEVEL